MTECRFNSDRAEIYAQDDHKYLFRVDRLCISHIIIRSVIVQISYHFSSTSLFHVSDFCSVQKDSLWITQELSVSVRNHQSEITGYMCCIFGKFSITWRDSKWIINILSSRLENMNMISWSERYVSEIWEVMEYWSSFNDMMTIQCLVISLSTFSSFSFFVVQNESYLHSWMRLVRYSYVIKISQTVWYRSV